MAPTWAPTACILCECNCGIEVRLGGSDGRSFERIRGDKAHPASKGYTCEKALRLDHYQNGGERLTTPLRRRPDARGTVHRGRAWADVGRRFVRLHRAPQRRRKHLRTLDIQVVGQRKPRTTRSSRCFWQQNILRNSKSVHLLPLHLRATQ